MKAQLTAMATAADTKTTSMPLAVGRSLRWAAEPLPWLCCWQAR
jgi:hypothetical protein